jgi:hypothetical protein
VFEGGLDGGLPVGHGEHPVAVERQDPGDEQPDVRIVVR